MYMTCCYFKSNKYLLLNLKVPPSTLLYFFFVFFMLWMLASYWLYDIIQHIMEKTQYSYLNKKKQNRINIFVIYKKNKCIFFKKIILFICPSKIRTWS